MQARDRLVRFGQHHPVLVAILVADHPFERRLDEILDNKIALIEQVV
jgi:SNF2 family DNA or RNA helicase